MILKFNQICNDNTLLSQINNQTIQVKLIPNGYKAEAIQSFVNFTVVSMINGEISL